MKFRATTCLVLSVAIGSPAATAQTLQGGPDGLGPEDERGVRARTEAARDGYTLIAPLRSRETHLVDGTGEVVHTWTSAFPPGNAAYLLDDGSLLRCCKDAGDAPFAGGGEGGRLQRTSWDGAVLWDFAMASPRWRQHHDVEPLANGNVLVIAWEGVSAEQAIAAGRDADNVGEGGLWPDAIFELRPVGAEGAEVVWEWHAWDHLVQDRDPAKPDFGDPAARPERIDVNFDRADRPKTAEEIEREEAVARRLRALGYAGGDDEEPERGRDRRGARSDWMHTNSIDHDPQSDLIAISVRSASEVWIIDHSTSTEEAKTSKGGRYGRGGDLVYRFGRPASWRGDGEQQLFHQHDARFVRADEGLHVTVFNNGSGRPGGDRSSADEFALPFTFDGGFARPADGGVAAPELVWSWNGGDEALFNGHICGAQRLEGGSTLVCFGEDGRVVEVTPDGAIAWDWWHPFRADPEVGRGGRRSRPGETDRGPRGGPPRDGPPRGGPPRDGPPREGRGPRRGGPGPMSAYGVFRVTRYEPTHPGLARL
ncbi:MAG: aryl-sulfate sulfotransferase [Planctomycetota bacterium]